MEPDLVQSQIQDSCRLALAVGLKDLMSDIAREVLRTQPPDIYTFITEYLSALIVTRESLAIACKICHNIYECSCYPHLDEELRYIGMEEKDVEHVKSIVLKYLEKKEVKESNLFMKLFKNTNLDEDMLHAVIEAVRRAFLRHQMDHPKKYQMSTRASRSVENTLMIYQGAEDYLQEKATKIQALFRGYLVRKNLKEEYNKKDENQSNHNKCSFTSASSLSLAGSFLNLPKYVPYSPHHTILNETNPRRYCLDYAPKTTVRDINQEKKKIGFDSKDVLYEIDDSSYPREEGCVDEIGEQIHEGSIEESCDEEICDEENCYNSESTIIHDAANERKSLNSDQFQQLKNNNVDDEENTSKTYNCDAIDDGELSKNERNDDASTQNSTDEEIDEDVADKIVEDSHESVSSLNDDSRDHSILIKSVEQRIDLKTSIQMFSNDDDDTKKSIHLSESEVDLQEEVIRTKRYSGNSEE